MDLGSELFGSVFCLNRNQHQFGLYLMQKDWGARQNGDTFWTAAVEDKGQTVQLHWPTEVPEN